MSGQILGKILHFMNHFDVVKDSTALPAMMSVRLGRGQLDDTCYLIVHVSVKASNLIGP